ncbi:hypothetical protein ACWGH8_25775 [Nonomuraea muscovyensis]
MLTEAARNNAGWCDAVCRAHGISGVFAEHAWTAPARTPPFYPDAVTLTRAATARDVLDFVDRGPGASVKDSFATLDLRPAGFEVLFEAQWISRPAPEAGDDARTHDRADDGTPDGADDGTDDGVTWEVVRDAATLAGWERACLGGEGAGVFRPGLLHTPGIAVLGGRRGDAIGYGFVLNATGRVAGVSNVFARDGDEDTAWAATLAWAAVLFPGRPLVGYEGDVAPARRHGFAPIGRLRVWLGPAWRPGDAAQRDRGRARA